MENNNDNSNTLLNINLTIISLVIVFYILYVGAFLIIPFVLALILAFALISTYSFFNKFFHNKFISSISSLFLYVIIFWLISKIINTNIVLIVDKSQFYQDQLTIIIDQVVQKLGIKEETFYEKFWKYIDLPTIFSFMTSFITTIVSHIGIIFFYLIFILLEYKFFRKKLDLMIHNLTRKAKVFSVIDEIKKDIKSYFLIKTFISFLVAFFSYILMNIFGLDFAMFWAFLIFILHFIPNLGAIIAIAFPSILCIVQFNNFTHFLIILGGLASIDLIIGNFIDPKLTGNKLNLSPLVILISLVFWGSIWGVVGMLLSVPIMVIINIILSKFEQTKSLAILLSEKGDVKGNVEDELIENLNTSKSKILKFFSKLKKKLDI